MTPTYRITCDGADITEALKTRLITCRIHDEAGFKNDRMELTLDNKPPFISHPPIGAKFEVWFGYKETGMRQMGVFEFDEAVESGPPHTMTIVAHAKSMADDFKGSRQRSWHGKTLGEIVSEIAGFNGLSVKIDSSLEGIKLDHIDQTAQSDMGFLTDLARTNDAVMKVANNSVFFAPKGSTKSQDGTEVEGVLVEFSEIGQYQRRVQARGQYAGVRGRYWDRGEAKEKYAGAGEADGTNVHTLPEIYNDKDAAERAAKSLFRTMLSSVQTLDLGLPGRPELMSESPVTLSGDFPPTVPRVWTCDRAEHYFDPSGYRTTITCVTKLANLPSGGSSLDEELRDNQDAAGSDGYVVTETLEGLDAPESGELAL